MIRSIILAVALLVTAQVSGQPHTIKAMSYNIRYNNPGDGQNAWPNRKDLLTRQILFYGPDILGMQEVLKDQLDTLLTRLPGYGYLGVGRDDGLSAGEFSPIFYRKDKLEVLASGTFWLSPTPEKVSKGWDAALPRICTYAHFKDKRTGFRFWHFNTHFDHRGVQARLESVKVIHQQILDKNQEREPVLISGDFNALPEDDPIQYMNRNYKDAWNQAMLPVFGPVGTFNGFQADHPLDGRIDYLFYSPDDWQVVRMGHLATLQGGRYPSDHLPVFGEFRSDR